VILFMSLMLYQESILSSKKENLGIYIGFLLEKKHGFMILVNY